MGNSRKEQAQRFGFEMEMSDMQLNMMKIMKLRGERAGERALRVMYKQMIRKALALDITDTGKKKQHRTMSWVTSKFSGQVEVDAASKGVAESHPFSLHFGPIAS